MYAIKIFTFFIICFFTSLCYGQDRGENVRRTYIKLSDWKKLNKRALTKQDSLNFLIRDNDTLVLTDTINRPPGISVPYTYKDSTFLDLYSKSAFRLKNDSTDYKKTTKYWKKPLKVFFGNHVSRKVKRDVRKFAKSTINLIDSLSIEFVNRVEDSNFIIYYDDDYDYESKMNKRQNATYYMHWKGSKISKVSIYIDNTFYFSDKLRLKEIKRLFIQSLGHFELVDDLPCDSYFSNCVSQEKQLTALDIEILKYHYDYGICKGTDLETFRIQHKTSKKLLKRNPKNKMGFFHAFEDEN